MSRSKTMNRRALLTGWRRKLSDEHAPQPARSTDIPSPFIVGEQPPKPTAREISRSLPSLRPPGAGEEHTFLALCDQCGECVRACPHDALVQRRGKDGSIGAPEFDMANEPCRLCHDRPCVSACPTGALSTARPTRIGRAYLRVMNCLATSLSTCSVCVERCPVDGVIELVGGKPRINTATCVGCGECLFRCPAPTKAITIMPI